MFLRASFGVALRRPEDFLNARRAENPAIASDHRGGKLEATTITFRL